jgi:hypothetical protein
MEKEDNAHAFMFGLINAALLVKGDPILGDQHRIRFAFDKSLILGIPDHKLLRRRIRQTRRITGILNPALTNIFACAGCYKKC